MARNKEQIEKKAISRIQNVMYEIEENENINIICQIDSNDKTPITDGFIRIDNKEIAVQVKGKDNESNTLAIDIKYYKYAKNNLLLFFYCDNIGDVSNSNIYYEFFSRKFLEEKLKGKNTQKSISHSFTKKLTLDCSKSFLEEFNMEFKYRDAKKIDRQEIMLLADLIKTSEFPEDLKVSVQYLYDVSNKYEHIINIHPELKNLAVDDVIGIYNVLNQSIETSKEIFVPIKNSIHTFVWTGNKYQLSIV